MASLVRLAFAGRALRDQERRRRRRSGGRTAADQAVGYLRPADRRVPSRISAPGRLVGQCPRLLKAGIAQGVIEAFGDGGMAFPDQVRVDGGDDQTGGPFGQLLKEGTGNARLAGQQDPVPAQVGDLGSDRLGGGAQEALAPLPDSLVELGDVQASG